MINSVFEREKLSGVSRDEILNWITEPSSQKHCIADRGAKDIPTESWTQRHWAED